MPANPANPDPDTNTFFGGVSGKNEICWKLKYMDRETEKRRAINYLSDLVAKLATTGAADTKLLYDQVYMNFVDARNYLIASSFDDDLKIKVNNIPHLIKPNMFNRQLGSLWSLSILGFVNPFITLLILTISFPISFPILLIRSLIMRQTKIRLESARIEMNRIINKLKEKE